VGGREASVFSIVLLWEKDFANQGRGGKMEQKTFVLSVLSLFADGEFSKKENVIPVYTSSTSPNPCPL
jgi:hypothetical protein